jgi:hypothetical protein
MNEVAARGSARVLVHRPALLVENEIRTLALLEDVSETGAKILVESTRGAQAGTTLFFEWSPVPDAFALSLSAEVLWARGKHRGLRFIALGAREKAYIRALLRFHR